MFFVTIKYFALLREQAGCAEEIISIPQKSLRAIYGQLAADHGFTLPETKIKAAVNDRFCDLEYMAQDGDKIVFIPPVAGG